MPFTLRSVSRRAFVSACCALVVLVTLLAAAPAAQAAGARAIVGSVHAHGPVRGATVKLLDANGAVIPNTTTTTDTNGLFVVQVSTLPTRVIFHSAGGRDRGGRIIGAMVNNHPVYTWGDPVVINPATTLADTYRRAHPGMTQSRANQFVQRYLGIPKGVDLGVDMRMNTTEFHGGAFLKAAGQAPQRYSARLVRHIDAGRKRNYHARTTIPRTIRGAEVMAFEPTHAQLVSGLSKLADLEAPGSGAIVGAVLGHVLGPDPDPTQIKLDHIIDQLNTLQASVNLIIGEQYHARVTAEYNTYNTAVAPYATVLDDTHDAWNAYTNVVLLRTSGASADQVAAATRHFMDFYEGTSGERAHRDDMIDHMRRVAQDFGRSSTASGFVPFQAWNTAVLDENRFVTPDTQEAIGAAWTYWRTVEAQLLVMNVEYAFQRPDLAYDYKGWLASYGRTATGAEGTEMANWRTTSKIDTMTKFSDSWIYDQASGLFWYNAPTGPSRFMNAVLTTANSAQLGSPYTMPTGAQLNALFARSGNWPSMQERGYSNGKTYLIDQGWRPSAITPMDRAWSTTIDNGNWATQTKASQTLNLTSGSTSLVPFSIFSQFTNETAYRMLMFPTRAGVDNPVPK